MDKNNFSTFLRNNINDTFWDNYIELVRNEMIPYQLMALNDEIDGAPKSYCLENFKKAAITIQKINNNEKIEIYPVDKWEYKENECDKNSFLGWCFQDSDVYKWIEAVAYSLKNTKDNALEQKSDEIINLICNAQMENGYLDTLYIINDRSKIFTNLKDRHELYCFGHLAEAAVAYYESTGKDKLLNSAIKFADLICDTFNKDNLKGYPGHEIAELALVKLYNVTKNEKYLKEAEFFIYERGTKPYYFDKERGYKRNNNRQYQRKNGGRMKTEYLRTASNSYMIIKDAEYLFEPYELQMVLRNKIEHLLSMQIMISDGKTEYWYDVTGMQSLAQKLTMQTAGGALVRKAAEEICGMKTELEEYLLQDIDIV